MPKLSKAELSAELSKAEALKIISGFADVLRQNKINIGIFDVLTFIKALGALGIKSRENAYWAGRASLVKNPGQIPLYDRIFESYWAQSPISPSAASPADAEENMLAYEDDEDELFNQEEGLISELEFEEMEEADSDESFSTIRYSATESLYEKDFAKCSAAELAEAKRAISKIKVSIPERISHKMGKSKSKTAQLDMRQMARTAIRNHGDLLTQAYLKPKTAQRKLVLILDISGSMEIYSRLLVRFAHAVRTSRKKVEVFVLSTRITRITRELLSPDPNQALAKVSQAVKDWSSGTRLGEGLREFNNKWGGGIARSADIVISSDGWDRGDVDLLAEQMKRLHNTAHRLIWVNPLKASEGYEPLAQGMAAALPFVDEFIEGHSVLALEQLADLVGKPGANQRQA